MSDSTHTTTHQSRVRINRIHFYIQIIISAFIDSIETTATTKRARGRERNTNLCSAIQWCSAHTNICIVINQTINEIMIMASITVHVVGMPHVWK